MYIISFFKLYERVSKIEKIKVKKAPNINKIFKKSNPNLVKVIKRKTK